MTVIPIVIGAVTKGLIQGLEDLEIKGTSGDHQSYFIVGVGYDTEKSSGDLRRLAVIQTPVKNHRLTRVGKTSKRSNTNNYSQNNNSGDNNQMLYQ